MKIIFILLVLATTGSALACQYTSNINELEGALEDRLEMRNLANELAKNSGNIFIGTVKVVGKNFISFSDIVNLKGVVRENTKFTWKVPSEILVGCSGVTDFANLEVPEQDDFDMAAYLVYAKEDLLLRVNQVGSFAEKPSGYEEVEWLKNKNHITIQASRPAE